MARLQVYLENTDLTERFVLESPNKIVEHVYFLEDGIASVVAVGKSRERIEVGLVGREGMSGFAVIMGNNRSPFSVNMQVAGRGWRISATRLRRYLQENPALHTDMLRFVQDFMVQMAHTAMVNGRGKLEQRLARWLLMAHDRMDGEKIAVTHEYLGMMLGVRRAGVTVALQEFEKRGLITTKRGATIVLDRPGIEMVANPFYGIA